MHLLPHVPKTWRNTIAKLCRAEPGSRCQSSAAAVNLIASLRPWICTVDDDVIQWEMMKGKRRSRVEWRNYLGRTGEVWAAWSEEAAGGGRRTMATSTKGANWKSMYGSLQDFFENRTVK
jgi:hypothetical protein